MSIVTELSGRLAEFDSVPFLFVGSGLSRRYLDTETWYGLLTKYAQGLSQPFAYYVGKADNDPPLIGSLISNDFYDRWFTDEVYRDHREKFSSIVSSRSSPLKIEISEYMQQITQERFGTLLPDELALLRKVTVDGVITTNYDFLLEKVFPDYRCFIGQEDLLFSTTYGVAEIYKIHGCASAPNSLVLTDADFADFERRNAYLAAKLLTIFVEHPIVFLGYSITDANIRAILSAIVGCLSPEKLNALRGRLFFVEYAEAVEIAQIDEYH
jgi:hypothetical protein